MNAGHLVNFVDGLQLAQIFPLCNLEHDVALTCLGNMLLICEQTHGPKPCQSLARFLFRCQGVASSLR